MNVKDIRRENLRALAKGIGGITAMAKKLNKSQSQISHLIGVHPIKNIGDRLAAQVEVTFSKPSGWLDKEHPEIMKLLGIDSSLQKRGYSLNWIPLIQWQQIRDWYTQTHNDSVTHFIHEYVPTNLEVGQKAFALRIDNDSFYAAANLGLPKEAIMIVDPAQSVMNGDMIMVELIEESQITIKQYTLINTEVSLKPIKADSPTISMHEVQSSIGVIRQIIVTLS